MKVVQINCVSNGSTGKIMLGIAKIVNNNSDVCFTFSPQNKKKAPEGHEWFGSKFDNYVDRFFSVFTGISGIYSKKSTRELQDKLNKIKPDVIHLHNLHGWYINIPMLFDYIKKNNIRTVWTLHDCWAFTAQCSHFTVEKCEKWKTGCYDCPRYRIYPYTLIDKTDKMWTLKKEWFGGVSNLTIVTPSNWLANLVKQSFLKDYPIKVINNGIDLDVFKPTKSEFRTKNNLDNKKIVLGVASAWSERKGIDVFKKLAETLDDKYKIVLVGTNDKIDKTLPKNIMSIHRTNNQKELAEIYSSADVFINPTREETYPTVNMEAIACGTPVVTFNTGGSPEIISDKTGIVVSCDDILGLKKSIIYICEYDKFNKIDFSKCSLKFDMQKKFNEYLNLYKSL